MSELFSKQFRLSITKALGDQLAQELSTLTPAPLSSENLDRLDAQAAMEGFEGRSGVYQLYRRVEGEGDADLVYVGKAEKSLSERLGQHMRKISGRRNISVEEMSFKCLFVAEDFSAVAPENLLIARYKEDGHISWNANGFGNKDPGRNRDRTVLKENHFDVLFPIDLDRGVLEHSEGERVLQELLTEMKNELPYNFRFQDPGRLGATMIRVPPGPLTVDDTFRLVARHLPGDWQVAALSGYVIMYKDRRSDYASAQRYYRGDTVEDSHPQTKAADRATTENDSEEFPLF